MGRQRLGLKNGVNVDRGSRGWRWEGVEYEDKICESHPVYEIRSSNIFIQKNATSAPISNYSYVLCILFTFIHIYF